MKAKKIFALVILLGSMVGSVCACSADTLNSAIEEAADAVGVDVDINITQEQVDSAVEAGKDAADKVKNVIEDEDVHNAAKGFIDSVTDAVKNE